MLRLRAMRAYACRHLAPDQELLTCHCTACVAVHAGASRLHKRCCERCAHNALDAGKDLGAAHRVSGGAAYAPAKQRQLGAGCKCGHQLVPNRLEHEAVQLIWGARRRAQVCERHDIVAMLPTQQQAVARVLAATA